MQRTSLEAVSQTSCTGELTSHGIPLAEFEFLSIHTYTLFWEVVGRSSHPLFLGLKQIGLLLMDQPWASPWRGCVHSSQGEKQALQLNKSSSGQIKLLPCHTAYNSIPSLLKEIYPLRLSKCYTIFSSNMCSTVPRGKENSALFSTLRKLFSCIILLLAGYSHLHSL